MGNVKFSGNSLVTLYINYMYEMNEKTFEYLINLTFTVFNPQECWLIGIPIVAMLSTILKVSQAFLNTLFIVTHGILEVRTFINTVWASGLMLFDTGSGAAGLRRSENASARFGHSVGAVRDIRRH